jgi:hypothetical protein
MSNTVLLTEAAHNKKIYKTLAYISKYLTITNWRLHVNSHVLDRKINPRNSHNNKKLLAFSLVDSNNYLK